MKAAPMFDLTAKTAEQLNQNFEIKFSNSNVLFWDKNAPEEEREADFSMPKYLFKEEVLKELEESYAS